MHKMADSKDFLSELKGALHRLQHAKEAAGASQNQSHSSSIRSQSTISSHSSAVEYWKNPHNRSSRRIQEAGKPAMPGHGKQFTRVTTPDSSFDAPASRQKKALNEHWESEYDASKVPVSLDNPYIRISEFTEGFKQDLLAGCVADKGDIDEVLSDSSDSSSLKPGRENTIKVSQESPGTSQSSPMMALHPGEKGQGLQPTKQPEKEDLYQELNFVLQKRKAQGNKVNLVDIERLKMGKSIMYFGNGTAVKRDTMSPTQNHQSRQALVEEKSNPYVEHSPNIGHRLESGSEACRRDSESSDGSFGCGISSIYEPVEVDPFLTVSKEKTTSDSPSLSSNRLKPPSGQCEMYRSLREVRKRAKVAGLSSMLGADSPVRNSPPPVCSSGQSENAQIALPPLRNGTLSNLLLSTQPPPPPPPPPPLPPPLAMQRKQEENPKYGAVRPPEEGSSGNLVNAQIARDQTSVKNISGLVACHETMTAGKVTTSSKEKKHRGSLVALQTGDAESAGPKTINPSPSIITDKAPGVEESLYEKLHLQRPIETSRNSTSFASLKDFEDPPEKARYHDVGNKDLLPCTGNRNGGLHLSPQASPKRARNKTRVMATPSAGNLVVKKTDGRKSPALPHRMFRTNPRDHKMPAPSNFPGLHHHGSKAYSSHQLLGSRCSPPGQKTGSRGHFGDQAANENLESCNRDSSPASQQLASSHLMRTHPGSLVSDLVEKVREDMHGLDLMQPRRLLTPTTPDQSEGSSAFSLRGLRSLSNLHTVSNSDMSLSTIASVNTNTTDDYFMASHQEPLPPFRLKVKPANDQSKPNCFKLRPHVQKAKASRDRSLVRIQSPQSLCSEDAASPDQEGLFHKYYSVASGDTHAVRASPGWSRPVVYTRSEPEPLLDYVDLEEAEPGMERAPVYATFPLQKHRGISRDDNKDVITNLMITHTGDRIPPDGADSDVVREAQYNPINTNVTIPMPTSFHQYPNDVSQHLIGDRANLPSHLLQGIDHGMYFDQPCQQHLNHKPHGCGYDRNANHNCTNNYSSLDKESERLLLYHLWKASSVRPEPYLKCSQEYPEYDSDSSSISPRDYLLKDHHAMNKNLLRDPGAFKRHGHSPHRTEPVSATYTTETYEHSSDGDTESLYQDIDEYERALIHYVRTRDMSKANADIKSIYRQQLQSRGTIALPSGPNNLFTQLTCCFACHSQKSSVASRVTSKNGKPSSHKRCLHTAVYQSFARIGHSFLPSLQSIYKGVFLDCFIRISIVGICTAS